MSELQIKEEFRPTRCEICHQSDRFAPETNLADRANTRIRELQ